MCKGYGEYLAVLAPKEGAVCSSSENSWSTDSLQLLFIWPNCPQYSYFLFLGPIPNIRFGLLHRVDVIYMYLNFVCRFLSELIMKRALTEGRPCQPTATCSLLIFN
jgi:hypothetical protein